MPSPTRRSLPSAPDRRLLDELEAASTAADVRSIQQRYDANDFAAAWAHISLAQRAALLLMRAFKGAIHHDLTPADFRKSDPL